MSGHFCGASGLQLKLSDMIKLGLLYLNDGHFNNKRFFSSDWVDASFKSQVRINNEEYYGFFWRICNNGLIYKASGAFGQETLIIPKKNLIIGYQCTEGTEKNKIYNLLKESIIL